ncbi:MAG: hypothetical protein ABIR39_21920 [Nocardioides sp.]|uniref:hypothetical protein n=1 Tax=Nocardioides sp. TaxID=35761 RepID=UPI003263EDFF
MGIETSKALRARRRESNFRIARLIAQSPANAARQAHIDDAVRLAKRRVASLGIAQQTLTAAEAEIGRALRRLTALGLNRNEAYALAGLSRALGRRYFDLSSPTERNP